MYSADQNREIELGGKAAYDISLMVLIRSTEASF